MLTTAGSSPPRIFFVLPVLPVIKRQCPHGLGGFHSWLQQSQRLIENGRERLRVREGFIQDLFAGTGFDIVGRAGLECPHLQNGHLASKGHLAGDLHQADFARDALKQDIRNRGDGSDCATTRWHSDQDSGLSRVPKLGISS